MDIIYFGLSSFQLTGRDVSMVIDPFDPTMVGLKFPSVSADIVAVSHDHEDHNQVKNVNDVRKVIQGSGEYEIQGVSIIGLPSYHDDKQGAERGKNTIYVIEIEGIRVVHLGDLGHKLKESDVEALGTVDVLMIPVGGVYSLDHKLAVEIVHAIEPKYISPMHFKMSGMNEKVFGEMETVDAFVAELGTKKEELKKLSLKASALGEEQIVVLLEKR